eukprot:3178412-Rhodomonas_salina.2
MMGDDAAAARRGGMSEEEAKKGSSCLAGFAKNYLPILFNAASTVSVLEREQVLLAIAEYALITERAHLNR